VSSKARRMFRGARGPALACGLVLAASILAGAAGMAADASGGSATQDVRADIGYSCQFASGNYRVSFGISATFPAAVTAGQQIQPTGVHLTVRLPHAAVVDLSSLGAATVSGSETLTTIATYPGKSVQARWLAHTRTASSIPATGNLVLGATAEVPPAAAGTQGTVTFSAGELALTISPGRADGAATSPATLQAECTPASGARARLAAVPVRGSPNPSSSAKASRRPTASDRAEYPKGCGNIRVRPGGVAVCGYITGYSDVAKLYGAALLQPRPPKKPGLINIDFAWRTVIKDGDVIAYSTAQLYYQGQHELPPVRATFLSFRFVPVSATLSLIEVGPINIVSVSGATSPPYPITVTATSKILIRLSDVTVNGVPLNVGAHCQTATPVNLTLIGKGFNTLPPTGYTVPTGGRSSSTAGLPRTWTRC
jgi:hypothetical protein